MAGIATVMDDPFKVMGLRRDSVKADVKKAYHELALKHHPDKNPGDATAEARFKEIHEAYELLMTLVPERRSYTVLEKPRKSTKKEPKRQPSIPVEAYYHRKKSQLQSVFESMSGSIFNEVFGEQIPS